ncbi:MAG: D-alanyl-D-alanine carboxypeptidase [Chloroflexi bacterium]|nr:D-alanyl-D-alanine carboxypeptidase [Chloroflexota bacterium]
MERRLAWLLLGLFGLACMGFGPPVLTESDIPHQQLTLQQIRTMRTSSAPSVGAASAILVNPTSGQILYTKNEHARRAPASLTKILTASVALQREHPDTILITEQSDIMVWSVVGLKSGERLTLTELLHYLLIPSDNATANTIARCIGGDVSTYVGWMNDLAAAWGMTNTHFGNAHGLDTPSAHTTAFDMALASYYAMQNPLFAQIVAKDMAVLDDGDRVVENTNKLVGSYAGAAGVKTGTTDDAGECLSAWVKRPTGTALSVVLGSEDRFVDSLLLLEYFFTNFAEATADLPPTDQNRYLDDAGNWRSVCLKAPVTMLVRPYQVGSLRCYRRIDSIAADHDATQPVGVLQITIGGQVVREEAIYLCE